MNDIAGRLRKKQAFVRHGYAYDATLGIDPDCIEAADEIERLRDIARRVAELPYFKNAKIEALVRDAKDALHAPIIQNDRQK